jgi:hypothetical protein
MARTFLIPNGTDNGRSEAEPTGYQLELGPPPERIDRQMLIGNSGLSGPNTNTWPATGGLEFLGHVPTEYVQDAVIAPPTPSIDDRAGIPAVFAGNPL